MPTEKNEIQMSNAQEMHYKEITPGETIQRVKKLLDDIGIELTEQIAPQNSIGTNSLRVNIKGTQIGTNGKGVNAEFAAASAYAEFMERLQNLLFDTSCFFSDDSFGFRHYEDEKIMRSDEIAVIDNAFMNFYWKCQGLENGTLQDKSNCLRELAQALECYTGKKDQFEVRRYYNTAKKCVEEIPYFLAFNYYGSNGMCAGNSPEEAIVQGLSEILERYVQRMMIEKRLSFPDVPETEIEKYPYVHKIYRQLKEIDGYYVAMKDCSMGGKYPVAALVISKKNTGLFGVKFGCHPDFGIAMERTLTEASQGIDVTEYASGNIVDFANRGIDDPINVFNSFKFGTAVYPYQLLSGTSSFTYTPVKNTAHMTNMQILAYMMEIIREEGFETWVRDVSYLGFCSYHIIVPGMSELFTQTALHQRASNTRVYLMKYINHPKLIDERVCKLLRGTLDFWAESKIDNRIRNIYIVAANFELPGEEICMGWLYMSAMCCAYLDEYAQAAARVLKLINAVQRMSSDHNSESMTVNQAFYTAVYFYLSARSNGLDHSCAMEYLKVLYSEEIHQKIDRIFSDRSQIFTSQYPDHDYMDKENCLKSHCCDLHIILDHMNKFKKKQLENPILQENLQTFFDAI